MVKGIIGKKVGMTQLFDESGKVIPVTVIEAGPCTVVQKKTVESDGYQAVQLGFGEVSAKKVNKAAAGHFKKANVAPKKTLREFRLDDVSAMNVGDILKADVFAAGDKVDVAGVSKGKGYQGVIKRFGQHRLRESHGTGPVARHAGSMGAISNPSRVFPGKRLPGHMGCVRVTVQDVYKRQGFMVPCAESARQPCCGHEPRRGHPGHHQAGSCGAGGHPFQRLQGCLLYTS